MCISSNENPLWKTLGDYEKVNRRTLVTATYRVHTVRCVYSVDTLNFHNSVSEAPRR